MSEMLDDIAYLSQEIGPRPAGTEEEQQASKYIAGKMQKTAGLRAEVEEFACDSQPGLAAAICFGVSVLMTVIGIIATPAALAAFFITLIVAVLYCAELFNKPLLSRVLSRGVSQNVVASYNPGTSASTRRRKIILVANYDSGKVRTELNPSAMGLYPVLQKASVIALVALPVMWLIRSAAAGVTGTGAIVFDVIFIVLAVLAAVPVALYLVARSASYNEAANDNAAGVAVLLELARRINGAPEPQVGESVSEGTESAEEAPQETDATEHAVVHGEEAARNADAVPEGADLVYDEGVQDDAVQKPQEMTAAPMQGQPIAAAVSAEAVSKPSAGNSADKTAEIKLDASPNEETQSTQAQVQQKQESVPADRPVEEQGLLVESAEAPQQLKAESDQEIAAAQSAAAEAARAQRRQNVNVPEWYRVAQEKAHRTESTKPVKRSRYADALDAAVAESSHHFEEAAAAVSRETSQYLNTFDRSIKEVAAPSDASTRGAAQPKNPSSADMMRTAKERAEAAVRERTRIDAEEDAVQERANMEQVAQERAAQEEAAQADAAVAQGAPVETKTVSRETVAFVDDIDGEIINAERQANQQWKSEQETDATQSGYIDEKPVEAESEYLDEMHELPEDDANNQAEQSAHVSEAPQTIDIKGLRAEVAAQNAMENDPVQRLQKAPTTDVTEAPKNEGERIVYDETDETSLPYYDEEGYSHTLENTKDRIESGFAGFKNRVKKIRIPKIHFGGSAKDVDERGYDLDDDVYEDNAAAPKANLFNEIDDDAEWQPRVEDDKAPAKKSPVSRETSSTEAVSYSAVNASEPQQQSTGEKNVEENAGSSQPEQTAATQAPAFEATQSTQTVPAEAPGDKRQDVEDPGATIGIAPIHIDAADNKPVQRKIRNIDLPKVESTGSIPPVIDQMKQRAPLAEEAERESETAAKTLLSSRIPRINLEGTGAINDKIEMDNKKAALRNTLPSMSGSITMMPPEEPSNNNTVSVAGSFASSAGTTGSFAPVGDELVADLPPEDRYVEDADDSAYETSTTETGAFAGPGYMEMPAKHRGLFKHRKKHKKNVQQEEQSAAQWLDVDENFNPTEVGAQRGGWESFRENSEYEQKQRRGQKQASKQGSYNDLDYEEWDDKDAWSDEWNGGAFSRSRAEVQRRNSSRQTSNNVDNHENEEQPRRRTAEALPPEFADVARIANEMAIKQGEPDEDAQAREMQSAYDFRNPEINCEVWFVALGAGKANNAGMQSFLDTYKEELRGSVIINLEALGAGRLSYLDTEGKISTKKVSTRVKRYLRMASQASGIDVQQSSIDWRDSPASAAMKRGLQAVTVVGMEGSKPALLDQGDDVLENISEEHLNDAADYIIEVLRNI